MHTSTSDLIHNWENLWVKFAHYIHNSDFIPHQHLNSSDWLGLVVLLRLNQLHCADIRFLDYTFPGVFALLIFATVSWMGGIGYGCVTNILIELFCISLSLSVYVYSICIRHHWNCDKFCMIVRYRGLVLVLGGWMRYIWVDCCWAPCAAVYIHTYIHLLRRFATGFSRCFLLCWIALLAMYVCALA